jgi:hypothetical protein
MYFTHSFCLDFHSSLVKRVLKTSALLVGSSGRAKAADNAAHYHESYLVHMLFNRILDLIDATNEYLNNQNENGTRRLSGSWLKGAEIKRCVSSITLA